MSVTIRLARRGAKKRPYYSIVAADTRYRRDGRFLERLGTYNPLLPKDHDQRVVLKTERIEHWLGHGAQVSDRVARFLDSAGVRPGMAKDRMRGTGKRAKAIAAKRAEAEAAAAEKAAAEAPKAAAEPVAEAAEAPAETEAPETSAEAEGGEAST
ncbi:MAG: 30S ribosomal protein S16 [Pseudomonadota bacterium]